MISTGETVPEATFGYIEYGPELEDASACGMPGKLDTSAWKGKKVVIFGVPGAFTPTCHANHLPPYATHSEDFKSKGVDQIAVIATNDLFVMSAWVRSQKAGSKIAAISDPEAKWLGACGLTQDMSAMGFGVRSKRFAMVIDDLKVTYLGVEPGKDVSVSGADAVLAKL